MAGVEIKNFNSPDESHDIPKGQIKTVMSPMGSCSYSVLQPGWKWSNDIKPIVGTEWCEVEHFEYVIQGHLRGRLKDGTEFSAGPGETYYIPPGHDGWVEGDEPLVSLSFGPEAQTFGRAE